MTANDAIAVPTPGTLKSDPTSDPQQRARYGYYNDKVVRQFAVMTVVWGIVGMLVGVVIAAQPMIRKAAKGSAGIRMYAAFIIMLSVVEIACQVPPG